MPNIDIHVFWKKIVETAGLNWTIRFETNISTNFLLEYALKDVFWSKCWKKIDKRNSTELLP